MSKLEVVDPRNPSLVRVATITEVEEYRVKIHFDGWSELYDYWFDYDSTDLHPVNWCMKTGHTLEPPPGKLFYWWRFYFYLHIFATKWKLCFLFCFFKDYLRIIEWKFVKNILAAQKLKFRLKKKFKKVIVWSHYQLHFLYTSNVSSWMSLPVLVGKDFEDARSCGTPGCRGIGHIKGLKYTTHHTSFGCPYTNQNLHRSTAPVVDRLAPNAMTEETSICNRIHNKKFRSPEPGTSLFFYYKILLKI